MSAPWFCDEPMSVLPPMMSMKPGYGSGNMKRTVVSSTFSILPGLPLIERSAVGVGVRSLFP